MEDEWGFAGFEAVVDEWVARDAPEEETRTAVITMLLDLRKSEPPSWLARRESAGWKNAFLCVMHLGVTNLSLAYIEDRDERAVTALYLGASQ